MYIYFPALLMEKWRKSIIQTLSTYQVLMKLVHEGGGGNGGCSGPTCITCFQNFGILNIRYIRDEFQNI